MGEVIITSDNSGESWSAAVWDPLTGSLLQTYKNAAALAHHSLKILNDDYLIAADVTKARLYLWALNSQSPVPNLRLTTPGKVSALSCTRDGRYLAVAVAEKILIWYTRSGRLLRTVSRHYQTVTCLRFTTDGSSFFSGGEDGLVFGWRLATIVNDHEDTTPHHRFSDHTLPIKDICLGIPGPGSLLVTVSLDRTARIYNSNTGILLLTLVFDVPLASVCMDRRDCNLFVGCSNGTIRQFDLRMPPRGNEYHMPGEKDGGIIFKGHTNTVTHLSVSVSGTTLLSGSADGTVNLWDIASRQVTRAISHKGPITSAVFTSNHINYRTVSFKPTINIRPLQRITEECGKDEILENNMLRENSLLFNENVLDYEDNETTDTGDDNANKLIEALAEIEMLKKMNAKLFKYKVNAAMNPKRKKIDI